MTKHRKSPAPVPNQTCNGCQNVSSSQQTIKNIYLSNELLVDGNITVWSIQRLLQESEKDAANDDSLQTLPKDDKEDWDGKDVNSHVEVEER